MSHRVRAVALAVCLAVTPVASLTACGDPPSSASPEGLTLLPSADPFTSAIVATKSLGTARLTVNVQHQQDPPSLRGQGVTVLGSGQGDLTWDAGTDAYRELVNGRGVYVQRPPQTGGWEQWPAGTITSTSAYADSLRGLGVLRDVVNEGPESLGPVATTRYRGWIPLTADEAKRLGMQGSPAVDAREEVVVWIDDFDHAVRVDRRASTDSDSTQSRTDFSDFSTLLNLTSPSHSVTATHT